MHGTKEEVAIVNMAYLVEWFQRNYPQMHQALLACNHNLDTDHLNPYHLESDCWSHTMMVCKVAELSGYDKTVLIAALLHDIGKPSCREINPRNGHVRFFGHEEVSAQMAVEVLEKMQQEGMVTASESEEVLMLIRHHGFFYTHTQKGALLETFGDDIVFCRHLVQLVRADSLGRFAPDMTDEARFSMLFEEIEEFASKKRSACVY